VNRWSRAARSVVLLGRSDAAGLERRTLLYYSRESPFDQAEYLAQGLQGWEVEAILNHFPPAGRILVAAAGGGRETLALAAMGYEATAFDPSDHLLDKFRALGAAEGRIVRAAPSEVPAFRERFDGVVIGWGGYTHVPESARRAAFLRALARQMKPGAPLLMSFYLRRADGWRSRTATLAANAMRRALRLPASVEAGDSMTDKFEHRFTEQEVAGELTAAALRLLDFKPRPFPHAVARFDDPAARSAPCSLL
jgi:2-polyprenyl-3-methyl-5-hydroxy-6-metoxy-1,4-benzoquinol methylase